MSEEYDVVLMGSDVKERGTLFSDYPQVLAVFGGADGSKRWERQVLCKQRPMIIGRTIFAEGWDLDERERNRFSTVSRSSLRSSIFPVYAESQPCHRHQTENYGVTVLWAVDASRPHPGRSGSWARPGDNPARLGIDRPQTTLPRAMVSG